MPGIVRKGVDSAGGKLLSGSSNVFANGAAVVRVGDSVEGHGRGSHSDPKMAQGSPNVFVNGIAVSRAGDKATCDDPATGSPNVKVN